MALLLNLACFSVGSPQQTFLFPKKNPAGSRRGSIKPAVLPGENRSRRREDRGNNRFFAVADGIGASTEEVYKVEVPEEGSEERKEVDYNWKEEWYPLYLTNQIPDDAPLALTVFDHQLVIHKDGEGTVHCHEDRCPHRLAKLSEGQIIDGRLECLYHGWQFQGDGRCVRIPQLPEGAKIPQSACLKKYEIEDSQGVIWVWMSVDTSPDKSKIPFFKYFDRPGFREISTIHELPYDHSILLENLMDPAHIPISHDRTDNSAKREDAQALVMNVLEKTNRGFAGEWGRVKDSSPSSSMNYLKFEAPCTLQNNKEILDKNGESQYFSALFLCRPAGQGKSMIIARFGNSIKPPLLRRAFPKWLIHQIGCKVFEQDMGFLSSQNEVLMKEKLPTKDLYLNLKSSDTWVAEYRKWMDKVGHGMPYHFGHSTISMPSISLVNEQAPAGLIASLSASMPSKGGFLTDHTPNPANRYFRHVVHCKECSRSLKDFKKWKKVLLVLSVASFAAAILAVTKQWKVMALVGAAVLFAGSYACSSAASLITTNFIRVHRRS
ncbi:Protein TIC 55, chloroplastic [Zostera marina]|uniref:Protein TIC 55, chloroplastic n=1 Tax=Zostera marina TaxID=29655 RepID=A0A0K9PTZ6_ZOSMR|nr:Protein TIC 55, chloroplastic [Zostera marina]